MKISRKLFQKMIIVIFENLYFTR